MTLKDALSVDNARSLSNAELRKVVATMNKNARDRLRHFNEAGETSPAVEALKAGGGVDDLRKIKKGKTERAALMRAYRKAKQFLTNKSGMLKTWRKEKETISKGLLATHGILIQEKDYDDFWKTYEYLKAHDPMIEDKRYKYRVLHEIAQMRQGVGRGGKPYTWRYIKSYLKKKLPDFYEEQTPPRPSSWFNFK